MNGKRWITRFKRWLFTPPPDDAFALTNIRRAARFLHSCEWEYRPDPGEEEHGKNFTRRYCKHCGREQKAFYHKFGNVRITWEDAPAAPVCEGQRTGVEK